MPNYNPALEALKKLELGSDYTNNNNDEKVNHPSHYCWLKNLCGVEPLDICRHFNFNLGNALKYIMRAGHKTEQGYDNIDKEIEDISKAIFYLEDYYKSLMKTKKGYNSESCSSKTW